MSPGERLAILAATLGGPHPARLLARAAEPDETTARAAALVRASRRERLAALAAASTSPGAPAPRLDGERAGVRSLASALCAGAPAALDGRTGPALVRRLLLERLLSEGA